MAEMPGQSHLRTSVTYKGLVADARNDYRLFCCLISVATVVEPALVLAYYRTHEVSTCATVFANIPSAIDKMVLIRDRCRDFIVLDAL